MTFFMHIVNCKRKKIVIAIDFCTGNHEMQTFHCNVANELSKQNLISLVLLLQGIGIGLALLSWVRNFIC